MAPRKGRHVLTPEERARGHKLTREDRVKGAIAANRIRGARGGKAAHARGTAHQLTVEDRRRGGLATAAKRRAQQKRDLAELALFGPPPTPVDLYPDHEENDPNLMGPVDTDALAMEMSRYSAGRSAIPGLIAVSTSINGGPFQTATPQPPTPDPFTLSALKRFRLGPISPLALTRSQRGHVDIMRAAGYLEADGVAMLRLTEKGRSAIEAANV